MYSRRNSKNNTYGSNFVIKLQLLRPVRCICCNLTYILFLSSVSLYFCLLVSVTGVIHVCTGMKHPTYQKAGSTFTKKMQPPDYHQLCPVPKMATACMRHLGTLVVCKTMPWGWKFATSCQCDWLSIEENIWQPQFFSPTYTCNYMKRSKRDFTTR